MTIDTKKARNAEKQARARARHRQAGFVAETIWLPPSVVADLRQAAETMRANPDGDYTIRLVNRKTGRTVSLSGPRQ
jgi:hypothetical protein